jgi:preprotein translocase subunit SecG
MLTTILLVIHIMAAFSMVVLILLQRSEGGALGMGGGGGGLVSGRAAANLLTKLTGGLAAVFFVTSLSLGVLGGHKAGPQSAVGLPAATQNAPVPAQGETAPLTLPDLSVRTQKPAAPAAPALPQSK